MVASFSTHRLGGIPNIAGVSLWLWQEGIKFAMAVTNDTEFSKGQSVSPAPTRARETLPEKYFWIPTRTLLSMSSAHFGVYFPAIIDLLRVQKKNSNHKKRKATKVSLEIVASLKSTQKIHCIMSKATMQRCF